MACEWPVDPACLREDWDNLAPEIQERAIALASETLRRLTGYRVGGCPVTIRPCSPRAVAFVPWQDGAFRPGIDHRGLWVNSYGQRGCGCSSNRSLTLPPPAGRVDEVKIDGQVLSPYEYRLTGNRLTLVDPDAVWPITQDVDAPDTEVGTFSVTYLNAYPVDSTGSYAAGVLAMEYARACTSGKCRLPAGVTNLVRQGVTMTIETGVFPGGFTGIREVDTYIAMWNPDGNRQESRVWSPDLRTY